MKKQSKLELEKFKIAKLQKPNLIMGGTAERTNARDPECGPEGITDNTQCENNG